VSQVAVRAAEQVEVLTHGGGGARVATGRGPFSSPDDGHLLRDETRSYR